MYITSFNEVLITDKSPECEKNVAYSVHTFYKTFFYGFSHLQLKGIRFYVAKPLISSQKTRLGQVHKDDSTQACSRCFS